MVMYFTSHFLWMAHQTTAQVSRVTGNLRYLTRVGLILLRRSSSVAQCATGIDLSQQGFDHRLLLALEIEESVRGVTSTVVFPFSDFQN